VLERAHSGADPPNSVLEAHRMICQSRVPDYCLVGRKKWIVSRTFGE
jgi:hypothetical protein